MGSENAERMYDFLGRKYKINAIEEGIGEFFKFSDFREKIQRLERTGEILVDNGFRDVVFNPSTVRGLAYYTGIVFEGFDIQGKFRSIFGGGRYDNLSSLFSGIEIPAVGFGMGDAVLENLMRDLDLWKQKSKVRRYYIIGIGDAGNLAAVKMAFSLRDRGIQAVAHTGGKNLSNALKTASNLNFTHAVMIGSKEIEEKTCTVRDLASGEQKNVNPDHI